MGPMLMTEKHLNPANVDSLSGASRSVCILSVQYQRAVRHSANEVAVKRYKPVT